MYCSYAFISFLPLSTHALHQRCTAKLLLRKRRHTPRAILSQATPSPRACAGSVAGPPAAPPRPPRVRRSHGPPRRPRAAPAPSRAAGPRRQTCVEYTRAANQSTSAHRPRLAEADGRPRESSLWRWRRVCWRAHGQTHWPRPLGGCSRLGGQTTSGWRRAGRA